MKKIVRYWIEYQWEDGETGTMSWGHDRNIEAELDALEAQREEEEREAKENE
jgi:hypothetical protein